MPSAPETRLRKVRRTRAGKKLQVGGKRDGVSTTPRAGEARERRVGERTRRRRWRCTIEGGREGAGVSSRLDRSATEGEARARGKRKTEGEGERGETDTMMSGSKRSLIWRAVLPMVQWMSS